MKDFLLFLAGFIVVVVTLCGVSWVTTGHALLLQSYFAPKFEQVRRETFEQSKAYISGMSQELNAMRFQYEQADEEHKAALKSLILRRVSGFDVTQLDPDTRSFIQGLR